MLMRISSLKGLPKVSSISLLQMERSFSLSLTSFRLHWLLGAGRRSFFLPSDLEVLMGVFSPFVMV